MDLLAALLDSWDRQARIVNAVASCVDESNKLAKPSDDGMPLYRQLAHMHQVRRFFLQQLDPEAAAKLGRSYIDGWENPIDDVATLQGLLADSGVAVRLAVEKALTDGVKKAGWYDNPVLYLQHMVWHEGWHVGLIFLALRLNGQEPPEEWEETTVWGQWRTEEW